MEFCFLTTNHLETKLWFKDDQDFRVCMNYVAIISNLLGIKVISFILMSNHVHFILDCSEGLAMEFIVSLKMRFGLYLQRRYGTHEVLKRNDVDIQKLTLENESLERAVAYVHMNSVAAGICANPFDYPWGTGSTFFKIDGPKGSLASRLSGRELRRLMHSHSDIPGEYIICAGGYISPDSYVPVGFVESVFRTAKRYNYFLFNSSKAKNRVGRGEEYLPSFRDQVLVAATKDLCSSMFHVDTVGSLDEEQQGYIVNQIRRRFSPDVKQIARVTGISPDDVSRYLDAF